MKDKGGTKGKIKLTKKMTIHIGKLLLDIRKKKQVKKVKKVKDIKYNLILTICKIWTGHRKYDKIATKMANEIFSLIDHLYRNKSGGGDQLDSYFKDRHDPEPESESDSKSKSSWARWIAIGQLCLSVYYIFSYATRSMELIDNNREGLMQIQNIVEDEFKSDAKLVILDIFSDKLEEAHLTSINPVIQKSIKDTHKTITEKYYLSDGPYAVAIPSSSGIGFIDAMFTEKQFEVSPLPVLCDSVVDCIWSMIKIASVSAIKEGGGGEYISGDIESEYKSNIGELKSMINDVSGDMSTKLRLTSEELRGEYPEFNTLMNRLEQPSTEYLKETLTNIVSGYPTGWWQLSQLLGIIEEIPFEVTVKLQEVLKKKTKKMLIVSKRMMTNTIEVVGNAKQVLSQVFILAGCIYYLMPKKKGKPPGSTRLLYLEDAKKKKTKRNKSKRRKKSKKSKKTKRLRKR